jgi:hypothetical protein
VHTDKDDDGKQPGDQPGTDEGSPGRSGVARARRRRVGCWIGGRIAVSPGDAEVFATAEPLDVPGDDPLDAPQVLLVGSLDPQREPVELGVHRATAPGVEPDGRPVGGLLNVQCHLAACEGVAVVPAHLVTPPPAMAGRSPAVPGSGCG